MSFDSKVVLITGASAGIGAATAILFAKNGANVAIVGRNETRLNEVAEQCKKTGTKALVIKADISKDDEAKSVMIQTIDTFGKLDVLINNAGILRAGSVLEGKLLETYDEVMGTNMRAVVHMTSLAAPYLVETKGNIVNISSVAALNTNLPGFTAYRISKAAMNHFTRSVALELAPSGVRVNTISPGITKTDIFLGAGMTNALETLKDVSALGKACEPEEIAELVLYVASDKAKSVTGTNFPIENGELLK